MAANKRKQDEKHLKMLREMVALPHNKTCFDCHQRGPTYVNMAIGSFVCTSCSGLLRGLNPPHRVKSISMTSFTPEEMDFLRQRGNDLCRNVWLGLYDNRSYAEPDSKDENKIKDFMCQKYEKKRWYVAPTEAMYQEAKRQNTPVKQADAKPLRTLVGNNVPSLVIQNNQSPQQVPKPVPAASAGVPKPGAIQVLPPASSAPASTAAGATPVQLPQAAQAQKPASGFDLLGDLGGDPFAKPAGQPQAAPAGGGFADFTSFNSPHPGAVPATQPAAAMPHVSQPPMVPQAFPPTVSSSVLQPMSTSNSTASASLVASTNTSTSQPQQAALGGDKYAALASLDNVFGTSANQNTVNWDPSRGGAAPAGGVSWGGGSGPATSSGGSMGMVGVGGPQAPATGVFGSAAPASAVSSANPFGTPHQAQSVANPFMSAGSTQLATSSAPGFGVPPPQQAGYGTPPQQQGFMPVSTAAAGFGQFPPSTMQNGFNMAAAPLQSMPSSQGGWPAAQQPQQQMPAMQMNNAFSQGAGVPGGPPPNMFTQAKPTPQQGFGGPVPPPQQQFGAWPTQQPVANPFMGASQPQAVPPRSNSTNPFL